MSEETKKKLQAVQAGLGSVSFVMTIYDPKTGITENHQIEAKVKEHGSDSCDPSAQRDLLRSLGAVDGGQQLCGPSDPVQDGIDPGSR